MTVPNKKIGLVLEGGAMRGMFTAGVIDVMLENDVRFDGVVGVSAGAAFGCNFKSHQAGRALRYITLLAHDWRFCSLRSLLLTGDIYGAEFAYHTVPREIDIFDCKAFDESPVTFDVVTTDVMTGKPVYKRLDRAGDEAFEWVRASASMPLCSRIVHIGEHRLLDGGIADSIPLAYSEKSGHERNVVVLTQPRGYVKTPNRLMPLMRMGLRKYPHLIEALENRHKMYNEQISYVEQAEAEGRALVIRPSQPLPIGHISHDREAIRRVYGLGREAATAILSGSSASFLGL